MRQGLSVLKSNIKKIFTLVWLVFLTGCASQVNFLPTLSEEAVVEPNKGVIVARVISAGGYPLPFNQFTIAPENLNASEEVKWERLESAPPKSNGTTVFAATANPGSYSLSSIRAFYSVHDGWYSHFVSSDPELGTFSVQAGQVTDLGTLIYYPKSLGDKYIETLIRLPEEPSGEVLEKFFSFYSFSPDQLMTWDYDGKAEERQIEYLSALQNPVSYPNRYLAPDGSIYFLAKLGVIIKRTVQGNWELDAVDTNLDLNTISQNSNGDLVVGGTEGRLFTKQAGGDWQDISLPSDSEIVEVQFIDEQTFDLVLYSHSKVRIFRGSLTSEAENWEELNSFDSLSGWVPNARSISAAESNVVRVPDIISDINLFRIGDESYVSIEMHEPTSNPVFTYKSTETFAYDPSDWRIKELEVELDFKSVVEAGAVQLGIKMPGFWDWDQNIQYFRHLEGEDRWDPISTKALECVGEYASPTTCVGGDDAAKLRSFTLRSVPWFKNELEALVVGNFSNSEFWQVAVTSDVEILRTIDGGKNWVFTGTQLPEDYCSSVVTEIKDRFLVSCNGYSGDFYESFDEGRTWDHVRQHENF